MNLKFLKIKQKSYTLMFNYIEVRKFGIFLSFNKIFILQYSVLCI